MKLPNIEATSLFVLQFKIVMDQKNETLRSTGYLHLPLPTQALYSIQLENREEG